MSYFINNHNWPRNYTANPMPTNRHDEKYAQKMRAYIARDQWADYQNRFEPWEDDLIDSVMSTDMLDQRLGAISINATNSSRAALQSQQQLMQRYGIQQNAQEKQSSTVNHHLDSAAATATAKNNTRQHIEDRNMAVMGGGQIREQAGTSYTG